MFSKIGLDHVSADESVGPATKATAREILLKLGWEVGGGLPPLGPKKLRARMGAALPAPQPFSSIPSPPTVLSCIHSRDPCLGREGWTRKHVSVPWVLPPLWGSTCLDSQE